MALLPFCDGFCHEFDYLNSRIYEEFGICPRDLFGHHHWSRHPWCNRLDTKLNVGKDGFTVKIDIDNFKRNEITVKTMDDVVIIEGKHKSKNDSWGCVSRQFSRKYKLPRGYDPEKVMSSLSSDGILTVRVPPPEKVPEISERFVEIEEIGPER